MGAVIPERIKITIGEGLLIFVGTICGILLSWNLYLTDAIRRDQVDNSKEANNRDDSIESRSKARDAAIWCFLSERIGDVDIIQMREALREKVDNHSAFEAYLPDNRKRKPIKYDLK